jgi:hypothetical protein
MDYPFPCPAWVTDLGPTVGITFLVMLCVPLLRIVMRRGTPRRIDTVLAITGLVLIIALPVAVSPIETRVLAAQGYDAAAIPYRSGSYVISVIVVATFVSYAVWLWTIHHSRRAPSKKWLEVFEIYGIAALTWVCLCPDVRTPREVARRVQCRNNLKQIGLGLHNYHDAFNNFPALVTEGSEPPRSWRVDLLPYMDHRPLREQYVDAAAWDAPANAALATTQIQEFVCPSSPRKNDAAGRYFTAYFGVRGPNTLFPDGRGMDYRKVTDGTSNTLAIVEACGLPVVWTEPRDVDLSEQEVGVNLPGDQPGQSRGVISSYHHAGGHVGLADGSVRFVSDKIDPAVLRALLTATGGEPPPAW